MTKTGDALNKVIANKLGTTNYVVYFSSGNTLVITDLGLNKVYEQFGTWSAFTDWLNE